MERGGRTGLGLILFAAMGLAVSALAPGETPATFEEKPYSMAVSGWSQLRLIELGSDWPTKVQASGDRLLYCRHVVRLAGLEIGTSCAREATAIADASL